MRELIQYPNPYKNPPKLRNSNLNSRESYKQLLLVVVATQFWLL